MSCPPRGRHQMSGPGSPGRRQGCRSGYASGNRFSYAGAMSIVGLDHVQVAIPAASEDVARSFYAGQLGMAEIAKPAALAVRGGCWFQSGTAVIHLGVEEPFAPARKAHPALLTTDLDALQGRLTSAGF